MKMWMLCLVMSFAFAVGTIERVLADPPSIPCPPHCTVDPCQVNPDRCKDKGGPIGQ